MLQDYSIVYYGLDDIVTGVYIKKIIDDYREKDNYIECLIQLAQNDIETLENYKEILKLRVILEYESIIPYINSEVYQEELKSFYSKLGEANINGNLIKGKILRYVSQSVIEIFNGNEFDIQQETLKVCIKFPPAQNVWKEITARANNLLLFKWFNEIYGVLQSKNFGDEAIVVINRVLFPISAKRNDEKIGIVLQIKNSYKTIFENFTRELSAYFDSEEFRHLNIMEQVKMLRGTLGSKILGVEGEIHLKAKLEQAEKIHYEELKRTGHVYEYTSEIFASVEKNHEDFREKFYQLTHREDVSRYQLMQTEVPQAATILDVLTVLDGVNHEKYSKASFYINFRNYDSFINVDTKYLMDKYKEVFWTELSNLVSGVEESTKIGGFLNRDINKLHILLSESNYFLAASFLTQIIERLLRESLFKLLYDVTCLLKVPKVTLGTILRKDSELNKLFTNEEIETLDYYLINNEYGRNLRNKLAHYNIDSDEVNEDICICLLHILIFILVKIERNCEALQSEESQLPENA